MSTIGISYGHEGSSVLVVDANGATTVVVAPNVSTPEVVVVGEQGPAGAGGSGGGGGDYLAIAARLSEFETPEAKAAARSNLGLDVLDAGIFT